MQRIISCGLVVLGTFGLVPSAGAAVTPDPGWGTGGTLKLAANRTAGQKLVHFRGTTYRLGVTNREGLPLSTHYVVQAYDRTGALAPSFGAAGEYDADPGNTTPSMRRVTDLDVQPDGKLLLTGHVSRGANPAVGFVTRLLPNGTPDRSFGTGGTATAEGLWLFAASVDAQGRVVATGSGTGTGATAESKVIRLLPTGALDTSFGTGGATRLAPTSALGVFTRDVAALPGGAIMVGAVVGNGDPGTHLTTTRLTSAGAIDTAYGTRGTFHAAPFASAYTWSFAWRADGTSFLLWDVNPLATPSLHTATATSVQRVTKDGALDRTFDGDGTAQVLPTEGVDEPQGVAMADGGIVLAGASKRPYGTAIVARLTSAGTPDTGFAPGGVFRLSGSHVTLVSTPEPNLLFVGGNANDGGDYLSRLRLEGPGTGSTTGGGTTTSPPASKAPPVIGGVPTVGNELTCGGDEWATSEAKRSVQWKRGGTAIAGATGTTYQVVASDVGQSLTCVVTMSAATAQVSATSAAVIAVAAPTPTSPEPTPPTTTQPTPTDPVEPTEPTTPPTPTTTLKAPLTPTSCAGTGVSRGTRSATKLTWTQPAGPRAKTWEVSFAPQGTTTWKVLPQVIRPSGQFGGQRAGATYTWRVRAVTYAGKVFKYSDYCTVDVAIPLVNVMVGNARINTINGADGQDDISGLAGDDRLDGRAGDDDLDGGAGNDTIDGGKGADAIDGGDGNDVITSFDSAGTDTVTCGAGYDRVVADRTDRVASDCERVTRR